MARKFKCPRPINKLVLHRAKNLHGPFFQPISAQTCVHTAGNFIGTVGSGPQAIGMTCNMPDKVQITFSQAVLHPGLNTGIEISVNGGAWTAVSGKSGSGTVWDYTAAQSFAGGDSIQWRYVGGSNTITDTDSEDIGDQGPLTCGIAAAPLPTSYTIPTPNTVVVTFDQPIQGTATLGQTIRFDGSPISVDSAVIDGNTITYTHSSPATECETGWTYEYSATTGDLTNSQGVEVANITETVLTVTIPPSINSAVCDTSPVVVIKWAAEVVVTDREAGVTIKVNGATRAIASSTQPFVNQIDYTLTGVINSGDTISYEYVAAQSDIQNTCGYAFPDTVQAVDNQIAPGVAPTVSDAYTTDANTIDVVFTENMVGDPDLGVTINIDAVPATITNAVLSTNTITYTISETIQSGEVLQWVYVEATGDLTGASSGLPLADATETITNNVSPPVTGADFEAVLDKDGVFTVMGDAAANTDIYSDRTTVATVVDHEGIVRTAQIAEIRCQGARRVENLLSHSEDFSDASWSKVNLNLVGGQLDPLGGNNAFRATAQNINGRMEDLYASSAADKYFVNSIWARRVSGSGDVFLYPPEGSGGRIAMPLTGSWQRFAVDSAGNAANGGIIVLFASSGDSIDIFGAQGEEVSGSAVQDVPSEYVSRGVLASPYHDGLMADGVRYFLTSAHNNTVDAGGVVTEGTPSGAITDWHYLGEPAATNYALGDDDLSGGPETIDLTAAGTGDYTLSVYGTAAVTVAAGTATGTGFGQATEGNDITFNLSVAGTITLTLNSGTLDTLNGKAMKQVEKSSTGTSYIETSGAAVTRTADLLHYDIANNFNNTEGTVIVDFVLEDVANDEAILSVADTPASILRYDGVPQVIADDGTNTSTKIMAPDTPGNEFRVACDFGTGSTMEVGYRDLTGAGAWDWDASPANYDGAFALGLFINLAYGLDYPIKIKNVEIFQSRQGKAWIEANR